MERKNYLSEDHPYYGSRTQNQWKKEKRVVLPNAEGKNMYANGCCRTICKYYLFEETRPATKEELNSWKAEQRAKDKARREEKKAEKLRQELKERAWKEHLQELKRQQADYFQYLKGIDRSKIVCLDVETTGLSLTDAEILQLSMVDGHGNVLFSEYTRPTHTTEWPDAMEVNGIHPDMVADSKTIDEYIGKINEIMSHAELIVSYNGVYFDIPILELAGVVVPDTAIRFDVMLEFAPIYGAWDHKRNCYKWQNLLTCAKFYGYQNEGSFHEALEDTRATLHCFHSMIGNTETYPSKRFYKEIL